MDVKQPIEAYKYVPKLRLKPKLSLNSILDSVSSTKSLLNSTTCTKSNFHSSKHSAFILHQASSDKSLMMKHPKPTVKTPYSTYLSSLVFPSSPSEVVNAIPCLPEWTKREIQEFPQIFFLSKYEKPLNDPAQNETDGEIKVQVGDDIAYRYEVLAFLGRGTFGQVVKVMDHKDKVEMAMKIVKNKQRYFEQAQLEVEILNYLKTKHADARNIVSFSLNFLFRRHMCICFELLHINLYEHLKLNNFRGLPFNQIKKISYQTLQALSFLNSHDLIHCDLKPENILLSSSKSASIKIIDFGSSCFTQLQSFTYIQSRFYRAPEIVLGMNYSPSIDMWSFGCILTELYTGIPIFPAENEKELISCITEVLGEPDVQFLFKGNRSWIYFLSDGHLKAFKSSKGKKRVPGGRSLRSILKGADEGLIELVSRCLKWNPEERIRPEEALKFEWILEAMAAPKVYTRYCKISVEDIIKHNPKLKGLMNHRIKQKAGNN